MGIKYIDNNVPRYSPRPGGKKASSLITKSTTSTTPRPPPSISVLEQEQAKRVETLRSTCRKYNLGTEIQNKMDVSLVDPEVKDMEAFLLSQNLPNRPTWQQLICSKEHKLSFCAVYKSASTFILKKFLTIAPSGKYDKESVKHLENQANVLARKEFGYLENWEKYPEFTKNGQTIIFVRHPFERLLSAFRAKLEDPSVKGGRFNEYYYNKYGRRMVMYYRKEKITGPTYKYPRFSEFIDFIVDKNDYFQSSTYTDISKEYFATIERDTIRKLYKRYKIDFELFGYSPDEYIKMGKPGLNDVADEIENKKQEESNLKNEEKIEDDEIVNPEKINVNQNYEKENEINDDISENDIKEVKTILSDDEKLLTAESNSSDSEKT